MYREALRPAWVEINLANLNHNIRQIAKKAGGADKLIGVIKADAYGHGAVRVAEVLRQNGVTRFAAASLAEAIALREQGAREEIIVLGLIPDLYADYVAEYDITAVCCDSENARALSTAAAARGRTVSVFIAADTGMGRIGYLTSDTDQAAPDPTAKDAGSALAHSPDSAKCAVGADSAGSCADRTTALQAAVDDVKKIAALPNLQICGLISHLSTADESDKTFSQRQAQQYDAFYRALQEAGIDLPLRSFANSAALMELPETHFDLVRPGIILYGCYPSAEVDRSLLDLRPVMSVKANIVHLKDVPSGFSVSYGRRFTAERPSRIATLCIGYADGLPRPYSCHAKVLVRGCIAPVAGNICMDQCMIDVTDVPGVQRGDEVILLGSDGTHTISADDIAAATGTINYEILCALGQRLPKIYL